MMSMEMGALLSLFCTLTGTFLGLLTARRTRDKQAESTGRNTGTMLAEIGYIKAGVDDIKRKQDGQEKRFLIFSERLTAVESAAKEAHHRLDRLEGHGHE